MKKKLLFATLLFGALHSFAQPAPLAFVPSNTEQNIYSEFDLSAYTGTWVTNRSSLPGYYRANFDNLNNGFFSHASDAHNVNGYVKRTGSGPFVFPVGTGTELRSLSMTGPTVYCEIATAWIAGDPSGNNDPTDLNGGPHPRNALDNGILAVSDIGQWDWQTFNTPAFGFTVTVSIPDVSTFAIPSNLRLVGWNGTYWKNLSTGPTANGNTAGSTLSGFMINGISAIAIASTSNLLDLTLSDFRVVEQNCSANISWTTTHEDASTSIEIEQSTNGASFTKIAGFSARYPNGGSYQFIANQTSGNPLYYRLKIISQDGSYKYSPVRVLTTHCGNTGNDMAFYPNPAKGSVTTTLRFKTDYRGKATMVVINNFGQQFINQLTTVVAGDNNIRVNTGPLKAGVYYVRLIDASGNNIGSTQKLIKQ